jgi:hypothetical protein
LTRSLRSLLAGPADRPARNRRRQAGIGYRPELEGLEKRLVLSGGPVLNLPMLAPALAPASHNHTSPHQVTTMLPLSITGIQVQNGQLVAQGLLGSNPFTAPLTLTADPAADPAACPILHLRIDAIHLDLLGLKVDTSNICLDITAMPGSGNLLGNLLCDVSHLLDGGTPLGTILGNLSASDLNNLTSGLTSLLNGALGQVLSPANAAAGGASVTSSQATEILHLSLGPVDLNLLGLDVHLDNCANGPVTVDITAQSGPGNLLGNLIGGLAHLLDNGASTRAVLNRLDRIAGEIATLLAQTSQQGASLLPITVNSVNVTGAANNALQLVANATTPGGMSLQIPLTLTNSTPNAATPILDLDVGAIHLDVLGLKVDTSPICLDITAQPGSGNLLGNLLSDVAHLLDQGLNLNQILGSLTSAQLGNLTSGISGLLNGALGAIGSPASAAAGGASVISSRTTEILHLALGPVDLNLLGLMVHLDNCSNGPVTVDITTQTGPGNLLGNLLDGLVHLLDNGASTRAVLNRLDRIAGEIAALL